MSTSQNGWPVLAADSSKLRTIVVPALNGEFTIRVRGGSAGFLLAHWALWFAEYIEKVLGKVLDDWGHAVRPVRGYSTTMSNHASGTAIDLNSLRHQLGAVGTFRYFVHGRRAEVIIRARLLFYRGCLKWGGDYRGRKDEMHVEINRPLAACERNARRLMDTPRGKRILAANPGLREEILS